MNNININTRALLTASVALFTSAISSGKTYTLEIPNINYSDTDASGLNNNGQIVGTAFNGSGAQTFAYRYDNLTKTYSVVMPPAEFIKPAEMIGSAINSGGAIIGTYSHPPSPGTKNQILHTGFCTDGNGATFSVDNYQSISDHSAVAITNNGVILETFSIPSTYGTQSTLHNLFGDDLGQLPFNFVATGINDGLVVAGNDLSYGAAIYNFHTKQTIRLNLQLIKEGWAHASAINQSGIVAGTINIGDKDVRGFLTNGYWYFFWIEYRDCESDQQRWGCCRAIEQRQSILL